MSDNLLIQQIDALKKQILANPQAAQELGPKLKELVGRARTELNKSITSGISESVCIGHCIQHCVRHQIQAPGPFEPGPLDI